MKNIAQNIIRSLRSHLPEVVLMLLAVAVAVVTVSSTQAVVYICGAVALAVITVCTVLIYAARKGLFHRRAAPAGLSGEPDGVSRQAASQGSDFAVPECMQLLYEDLKTEHCNPEFAEDGLLVFRYQGGYFNVSAIDAGMVRILFPRIYSVSVLRQDFLCRVLNRINTTYALCRLIATPCGNAPVIEVHAMADIYYNTGLPGRISRLRDVLGVFFSQQRSLAISVSVDEIEQPENSPDEPDECLSAYKNLSLN